ncbi:PhoX family protein [Nocardioides sp. GCM10027113]|uniref:PhoX family protein n=1 Tax=unclassified Nocardioides TaxID=2615069 RepID=UPI0036089013
MTQTTHRPLLPLFPTGPHGSRSAMTCHYRCGDACDKPIPNTSSNEHIQDVVARAVQRRSVLRGAAIGAGTLAVGGLTSRAAAADKVPGGSADRGVATAGFSPVPPNKRDALVVPNGFRHDVVMRWGDPVVAGAPAFDVDNQTPEAAALQFGYNCDYVGVVPVDRDRALLVVNHEYTDEPLMFPTGRYDEATQKRIAMASHGLSVVMIKRGRVPGSWFPVDPRKSRYNRRLHVGSQFELTGPAAGDERLRTSADPTGTKVLGTLNNCSGGTTPWGTILSGEENFNGYFDASGSLPAEYATSYARYGITGSGRGWSEVDSRFDVTTEPHEPFRFGWVVETDPMRPGSAPRKRTMLGRFKHEGANIVVNRDGRVAAYMGDDERNDYLYKFVSRDRMDRRSGRAARRHNMTLLDHGTLYVAVFTGDGLEDEKYDGTGRWIPLTSDTESFVDGMSVSDVLIDTRLAADKVGATKMDRPEDVEGNPANGKVYVALTNNSGRGTTAPVDEANPVATSMVRSELGAPLTPKSGNRNGYVLELTADGENHAATTFTWELLLVCGDPEAPETYFGGYDKTKVSPISCPDNVTFDSTGNLWISTDGNQLGSNDGIFRVPVSGPGRGHVQQFLTVPRGAEACGPLIADDDRSLWVAVQHPGEVDGATFESPASTWPHTDDFPRPSVAVVYRRR